MVHGSWFMVLGPFLVHGSWFLVQGSGFRVHGSGFRARGATHGASVAAPGVWGRLESVGATAHQEPRTRTHQEPRTANPGRTRNHEPRTKNRYTHSVCPSSNTPASTATRGSRRSFRAPSSPSAPRATGRDCRSSCRSSRCPRAARRPRGRHPAPAVPAATRTARGRAPCTDAGRALKGRASIEGADAAEVPIQLRVRPRHRALITEGSKLKTQSSKPLSSDRTGLVIPEA